MKWIVLILCFAIASIFNTDASGQVQTAQTQTDGEEIVQLSGYVLANDSLTPLAGVHVLNMKNRMGTTTNEKGFFNIPIHRSDTILFTAIGYESKEFVLDPSSRSNNPLITVKLIPKTYVLKEVDVYAIPTEEQFKENFLSLKLPDEPQLNMPKLNHPGSLAADPNTGLPTFTISGPFSALYNKFSREGREMKKMQYLNAQELRKQQYDSKFNAQLVGRVTGLKDADLEEFMKYCKLPETVVLNARNEYEIVLAIGDCFKDFKQMKRMN